ncbi:MAG: Ig-like domain-containing protein [Pseudomonadota bacterium]
MRALLPTLLLLGCSNPEGYVPGECFDGADNDGDGLYDCDDADCEGAPGCGEGDADVDADTDGDADADGDCDLGIDATVPQDGAADAYYRAEIEFWLEDVDPGSPVITLEGASGRVDGVTYLSDDLETVFFRPDAPLAPQSAYSATLDYCRGEATIEFTTSELGRDLELDPVGRVFLVDLTGGRFLQPQGIGELLGEFLTGEFLLGVEEGEGADFTLLMGLGVEGGGAEQDPCVPTIEVPWSIADAPDFRYGPADTPYLVGEHEYSLQAAQFSGTFAPDATWLGGGQVAFVIDARLLVEHIDEVDTWQDFCALTASFGAPCQGCDDGVEACLAVYIDQIEGAWASGASMESVPPEGGPECAGPVGCGCGATSTPRTGGILAVLGLMGAVVGARRRR